MRRPCSHGPEVRGRRRAFTLIEIILVIALIAIFAAIFVVNFDAMLRQSESEAVESAFWTAAREARMRALVDREPQSLRFDERTHAFVVEVAGTAGGKPYPIDQRNWAPDTSLLVEFQKRLPASQFSLVGGNLVEMRRVPLVQFFPDGTCTPFVLSMIVASVERSIEIDPWTGAELLAGDDL